MSNYVLKYARDERVRYISHLDFIRMFHRTVRRAGLEMSFSHGYNPHPIMTVAMPLSVGVTSDCEYMKIGFDGEYTEEEIKNRLNASFPRGFSIINICKTEGKQHDFSKLDRAVYIVEIEGNTKLDEKAFLANPELKIMKKSKSGIKESDIRPYIYDFDVLDRTDDTMKIRMCIAAGNSYNLKVDSVIEAMEKYCEGFKAEFFCVHREKILAGADELL